MEYFLFEGDCLEVMPSISDNSIDMIMADLPYGTTACKWDSIIPLGLMWMQLKRVYLYCKCGCGSMPNSGKMFISGHNRRGKKNSLEVKEKMSQAAKKRARSPDGILQLQKLAAGTKGKKQSPEHLAKLSLVRKGKKVSEVTKAKMSTSHLLRRHALGEARTDYCDEWFDMEYRNSCRKNICESCGLVNLLSMKVYGLQLATHHKHGKRKCAPDDIQTLCASCHARVHHEERRYHGR